MPSVRNRKAVSVDSIGHCGQHWTNTQTSNNPSNIIKQTKVAGWFWNLLTPRNSGSPSYWRNVPLLLVQYLSKNQITPPFFSWESASSTSGKLRGCNWRYPLSPRVQRQHLSLLATGGDVASDFPKESTFVAARQLWWLTFTSHWPSQRCFFRFPKKALITSGKGSIWSPMITRFSTDLESTWQKTESVWCCFSMHSLPTKKKDSKLGKSPGNVSLH